MVYDAEEHIEKGIHQNMVCLKLMIHTYLNDGYNIISSASIVIPTNGALDNTLVIEQDYLLQKKE